MHAYTRFLKMLVAIVIFCGLAGFGEAVAQEQPYQKGWSHNCKLSCTNVSVNQAETVERPGRISSGAMCEQSKETCEAARTDACAEAVAVTNNETLYDNCRVVSAGACKEGCTVRQ